VQDKIIEKLAKKMLKFFLKRTNWVLYSSSHTALGSEKDSMYKQVE